MPNKQKAMAAGVIVLAMLVGVFALWSSRNANKAPQMPHQATVTPNSSTAGNTPNTAHGTAPATADPLMPASSTSVTPKSSAVVPESHTVKQNETLRSIATMYYNDAVYAGDIEALNNLPDPNHIMVGQKLTLPRPESVNHKMSHSGSGTAGTTGDTGSNGATVTPPADGTPR